MTFTDYRPAKLGYGAPHPDPVVETASLAAVEPPDVTYELHLQARCPHAGTVSSTVWYLASEHKSSMHSCMQACRGCLRVR